MTTPRKPLKPVKGWVVVGPEAIISLGYVRPDANEAWLAWTGELFPRLGRRIWEGAGYRAIPVVVMERGKSR